MYFDQWLKSGMYGVSVNTDSQSPATNPTISVRKSHVTFLSNGSLIPGCEKRSDCHPLEY